MEPKYSIEDTIKIAELSAEFGEEMQGLKRNGLQSERKYRIEQLLKKMVPYRDVFESFLKDYIEHDNNIKSYSTIFKFKVPEE